MKNVANTEEYKKHWDQSQPLFRPDYFVDKSISSVSEQVLLRTKNYSGKVGEYHLRSSINQLLKADSVIAEWKSIDNNGDFYQLIKHSNGREYLVFRQDLYGYSVLDIAKGEIMQYFPESSLNGGETFIWVGIDYNPLNDLLAVSGCFWVCPFSVQLCTFADPMLDMQTQLNIQAFFKDGYDLYDDIDFERWDGTDLLLTRYVVESESKELVTITAEEYERWFDAIRHV